MSLPEPTLSLKHLSRRCLSALLPLALLVPLPASQAQPLALAAATQSLPVEVSAPLQRAGVPLSDVALLVAPADGGAPLVSHRVTQPMNPASVMKLVTTGIALDQLGPGFRWETRLWTDGSQRQQLLQGNLYVQGSGDPGLVQERLWLLLRALRERGVQRISGDLVLDNSVFQLPARDPGAFDGEPLQPYNAQPDGLLVNYKAFALQFQPDAGQGIAHVRLEPPMADSGLPASLPLTEGSCNGWIAQLEARSQAQRQIVLPASYPSSCGDQQWLAAWPQPQEQAGKAILGMWQSLGGQLDGRVRYGSTPATLLRGTPLASSQSEPLPQAVRHINKFSNNVMAQQLFLTLGVQRYGQGHFAAAQGAVRDWWQRKLGPYTAPTPVNGSGLSREGRISAASLGGLLQYMWRSPMMPDFVASLPIYGMDGTLRKQATGVAGRAHLKTGTLRDASALAGYVTGLDGRRYVLVAMANGPQAGRARDAFYQLVEWTAMQPGVR